MLASRMAIVLIMLLSACSGGHGSSNALRDSATPDDTMDGSQPSGRDADADASASKDGGAPTLGMLDSAVALDAATAGETDAAWLDGEPEADAAVDAGATATQDASIDAAAAQDASTVAQDASTGADASVDGAIAQDAGPSGACLGGADKAVFDTVSIAQLSCEGDACVGKNLDVLNQKIKEAETAACIAKDAPNLKRLSSGCQDCFAKLAVCVPTHCVQILGGSSNACFDVGLPNTDFAKCSTPTIPSADCKKCKMDNCQAAFIACSGLVQYVP